MADHHPIEQAVMSELPVGLKLDLPPGLRDIGERLVAICVARAMAGEVLDHGDDASFAMGEDEGARQRRDGIGIGAEAPLAPADHRIVGVEIEVDHGAEIEVEAGLCQLVGHRLVKTDGAFRRCEARVPANAPRRGEICVSIAMGEPLHEAAFLIDGDEGDR